MELTSVLDPSLISVKEVAESAARISSALIQDRPRRSRKISNKTKKNVYLMFENIQETGTYEVKAQIYL